MIIQLLQNKRYGFFVAPHGAGRPIPSLFVPLANGTAPAGAPALSGIASDLQFAIAVVAPAWKDEMDGGEGLGFRLGESSSGKPSDFIAANDEFDELVNMPKSACAFGPSEAPNVNGNGPGRL